MKKWRITKDRKHTVWVRETATIEAETPDEVIEKFGSTPLDSSTCMEDTLEPLSVMENFVMAEGEYLVPDYHNIHAQSAERDYPVTKFPKELCYEVKTK